MRRVAAGKSGPDRRPLKDEASGTNATNAAFDPNPETFDLDHEEMLQRVGLGTPDVLKTVAALRERGMAFVESKGVHTEARGALTQSYLGGVMFELVHDERR